MMNRGHPWETSCYTITGAFAHTGSPFLQHDCPQGPTTLPKRGLTGHGEERRGWGKNAEGTSMYLHVRTQIHWGLGTRGRFQEPCLIQNMAVGSGHLNQSIQYLDTILNILPLITVLFTVGGARTYAGRRQPRRKRVPPPSFGAPFLFTF
jgi:hypothetical protein